MEVLIPFICFECLTMQPVALAKYIFAYRRTKCRHLETKFFNLTGRHILLDIGLRMNAASSVGAPP